MYLLTDEQLKKIIGKIYHDGMYFNPVQDIDNKWFISIEEVKKCSNNFEWVKKLPLMKYKPIKFKIYEKIS